MASNFEFLDQAFPVLSAFGRQAEAYCFSDSNSCLIKLGMIGETIVNPSVIDYQCKDYLRCIREEDADYQIGSWGDYKVPLTFATNGRPYLEPFKTKSGIWFLDLRKPSNNPELCMAG